MISKLPVHTEQSSQRPASSLGISLQYTELMYHILYLFCWHQLWLGSVHSQHQHDQQNLHALKQCGYPAELTITLVITICKNLNNSVDAYFVRLVNYSISLEKLLHNFYVPILTGHHKCRASILVSSKVESGWCQVSVRCQVGRITSYWLLIQVLKVAIDTYTWHWNYLIAHIDISICPKKLFNNLNMTIFTGLNESCASFL